MTVHADIAPPARAARRARVQKPSGSRRESAWQLVTVVAFLVLWHLFSLTETAQVVDMPGPVAVVIALGGMVGTAAFWAAIGATLLDWVLALLVSCAVGIPLGLLLGRSRRAALSAGGLIDFLRTIPSFALVPILLLILGPTTAMVVFAAAFAGVWPLLIQAMYAAEQIDPVLQQVSRAFRLRPMEQLRFVVIPELVAFLWPGFRLATIATLLVTVGAELLGGAPGIGSALQQAQLFNLPDVTYAWVVVSACLGLLANGIVALSQRRALWWHPSVRGGRA